MLRCIQLMIGMRCAKKPETWYRRWLGIAQEERDQNIALLEVEQSLGVPIHLSWNLIRLHALGLVPVEPDPPWHALRAGHWDDFVVRNFQAADIRESCGCSSAKGHMTRRRGVRTVGGGIGC